MSVNKYRPHVFVLPEDGANRQLANGFVLNPHVFTRGIQVLAEAGGWIEVLNQFKSDHVAGMQTYPERHMVLLLDFDGDGNRLTHALEFIPEHLRDRVFIIGVWTQPESLRATLGSFEMIGYEMAVNCQEDIHAIWNHDLLRHNDVELTRLRSRVRPILFQPK